MWRGCAVRIRAHLGACARLTRCSGQVCGCAPATMLAVHVLDEWWAEFLRPLAETERTSRDRAGEAKSHQSQCRPLNVFETSFKTFPWVIDLRSVT